ncbi:CHAT domain-containing protein [Spirulina sp. 06S082]|uniref:CHAT domain-containing protein n=1 Tax=Spirulina sp. 06S082 TaxID=3110248 RepID=UPI002B21198E|nr:CHAT domain-containing protein [Spirulina sp. 06S082]MEA5468116.1 CHAT domain-containing protein [Spirulina sp. 06S082]
MSDRIAFIFSLAIILGFNSLTSLKVRADSIESASDGTGTNVNRNSNTYLIQGGTQTGTNLFHSFQEFGLSAGEIAHFLSQPNIENILARVTGGNPSLINGLLQVSGGNSHLYLMNPAGIVFGSNASLNVPGDFFATTATGIGFGGDRIFQAIGSNDYDSLLGMPTSFDFGIDNAAPLINAGNLSVGTGHNIMLTGGTVINTGQLNAPGGNITIAAIPGTNRVKISQAGMILSLEPDIPTSATGNPLTLTALDLPALLVGAESQGIETGLKTNNTGEVQLASGENIPWETGTAIVTGNVDVSLGTLGSVGGNVGIFGDRLALFNANIDASGDSGGGTVLIGGEYQGLGDLPTGDRVYIDANSTIRTDALSEGDGGRVIVWADEITGFYGNISARGGQHGGNGGFVETSGKQDLIFRGDIDVSASQGQDGFILLDPQNINIVTGAAGSQANDAALGDNQILFADGGATTFTISTGTLQSLSGTILLQATQDISTNIGVSLNFTAATSVTFQANNNIFLNNATLNFAGATAIAFIADADNDGIGDVNMANGSIINTNGADLNLTGARLFVQDINAGTGKITLNGKNEVTFNNTPTISTQDLTIRSDIINLAIPTTINGTGNLVLETATASRDIILGGTGTLLTALDLTTSELQTLQNGFSSVTIGRTDGTGNITLSDPNSLIQPTHIAGAGNFIGANQNAAWTLTGSNSGSLGGLANSLTFSNVAKITGGNADDTFAFTSGVNFNGNIDGGAGFDTLDYANYGNAVSVDIFNGTATGTLGIANIETFISPPTPTTTTPTLTPTPTTTPTPTPTLTPTTTTISLPASLVSPLQTRSLSTLSVSSLNSNSESLTLSRDRVGNLLDRGNIEEAIVTLDAYHSQSFLSYFSKDKATNVPSLEDLQLTLHRMSKETGEMTASLYIFSRSDRLDLILVPPTSEPIHYSIPDISQETLLAEIYNFQNAIAHPLHRRNTRYLAPAQQLYKWLIAPAEKDLQHFAIKTIMFVLDDGLRTLPMAALHDGNKFLVENYALSLVPSLYLVPPHYVDIRNSSVVAMGMSKFTNNGALPAVPVEVDTIAQKFNAPETFLNETFTLKALQRESQRNQTQILHLATHGQFQPGIPSESYIQLWDRPLTLEEMGALNWGATNIELLVLSACRTALGDESAEYGFAGLTIQSGISSAVASLWYADDAGTLALMTEFYRQLRETPTKAQALRQGQMALIQGEVRLEKEESELDSKKIGELVSPFGRVTLPPELANLSDRNFQHPYYWAGFTMIGSPW